MKKSPSLLLLSFLLFFLSSCGYRYNEASLTSHYRTISIPYIKGDPDGRLTNALIKEISYLTPFLYLSSGGELLLDGTIAADNKEIVGYRYDRKPVSGRRVRRLIATEEKRELTLRFSLIDTLSKEIVYGPVEVSAQTDYDFLNTDSLQDSSFIDQEGVRESSLFFSLGQLDSIEGASDVARRPLHEKLAHLVADGINNLSLPHSKQDENRK
ncbi:MAG: hypothetical protein HYZ47_05750 [Simkania negevensis]|nr:hypothetical protein [Simkania negevensis]